MVQNLFGDLALDSTIKFLKGIISRFTFDTSGQLRTVTSGSVSVSGSLTTITTVTTSNESFGDMGKASTVQLVSQQNFMSGVRRNFA